MADNLVIVESPAKAKTIQKFLGDGYEVKSSFGHIRDLQDKKLSVDVEKGFTPEYVVPADKKKVVGELRKAAEKPLQCGSRPMRTGRERQSHGTSSRLSDLRRSKPEESFSTRSQRMRS